MNLNSLETRSRNLTCTRNCAQNLLPQTEGEVKCAEASQFESKDPYSYYPPNLLPRTEGEVKCAVEDLTQKLRIQGMARRQITIQPF